jgi:hypothetical protein
VRALSQASPKHDLNPARIPVSGGLLVLLFMIDVTCAVLSLLAA